MEIKIYPFDNWYLVLSFFSSSAPQKKDPQRNNVMLRVDNLAELGSLTEVGLDLGVPASLWVWDYW